jgi:nitrate/nitrite-specific signal transduction histidine kinase
MNKARLHKADLNESETVPSSSSIIARAGQIMAIFITIGVIGMLSSMLVSESLSGDAAQINRAGALRMQAIRISRELIVQSAAEQNVNLEFENFQNRLNIYCIWSARHRRMCLFHSYR